jgi:hypothetical protein
MTDTNGGVDKHCVPTSGECACSEGDIQAKSYTTCFNENEYGLCSGHRTCDLSGLTSCDAKTPEPEICDGLDNDCDGYIDNTECVDANPCTSGTCTEGQCVFVSYPDGEPCDDGDPCTSADMCQNSGCSGTAGICNDGLPCTADQCDADGQCHHTPLSGTSCHDDDACTDEGLCEKGECITSLSTCDDGNPCTSEACAPGIGCLYDPMPMPTLCTDNNACTTDDVCINAECVGQGKICFDDNPCTMDQCNPMTGCLFKPAPVPCSDNNPCTANDICSDGVCAGTQMHCDDGNSCTHDVCEPDKGCTYTAQEIPTDGAMECPFDSVGNGMVQECSELPNATDDGKNISVCGFGTQPFDVDYMKLHVKDTLPVGLSFSAQLNASTQSNFDLCLYFVPGAEGQQISSCKSGAVTKVNGHTACCTKKGMGMKQTVSFDIKGKVTPNTGYLWMQVINMKKQPVCAGYDLKVQIN